jgi:hypothetical protein
VALVVVAALVVGAIIFAGGGDGPSSVARAQADVAAQQRDIDAAKASLLTRADLGTSWTITHEGAFLGDDLKGGEECDDAAGLRSNAQFGRSIDFSYDLDAQGRESAHAAMWVRAYRTAEQAEAQFEARAATTFGNCVATFALADMYDSMGTAIHDVSVARVQGASVRAAVYRVSFGYTFQGAPKTEYGWRAYVVQGRFLAGVVASQCCVDPGGARIDELVRTASQRLALHAPGG